MADYYLSDDDVHNWSAYARKTWAARLTTDQMRLVAAAEYQHHQKGKSARDLSSNLNREFGFTDPR